MRRSSIIVSVSLSHISRVIITSSMITISSRSIPGFVVLVVVVIVILLE